MPIPYLQGLTSSRFANPADLLRAAAKPQLAPRAMWQTASGGRRETHRALYCLLPSLLAKPGGSPPHRRTGGCQLPLPIAVLASGEGTNLQAILDAIAAGECPAVVRLVVSDQPRAKALARARAAGVATRVLPAERPAELAKALQAHGIALVCLAGYLRIVPAAVVALYRHRILNIHPALLPAYPGLHAIRRALAHGDRRTGVTVHFVDAGVDTGPILLQEVVPIEPHDTEATLTDKIHAVEHRLYPRAVRLIAEGKVRVAAGKVLINA